MEIFNKLSLIFQRKRQSIDYYDILYNVLCVSYSKAYLSGSSWYVGESLREWLLDLSTLMEYKMVKYVYVTEIIDDFMNVDHSTYFQQIDNDSYDTLLGELEILELLHPHLRS